MIPDQPLPPVRRKPPPAARQVIPLSPLVVEYATACERILWSAGGRSVREWLHGRGFDDDLLRANHIGADPGRELLHRRRGLPFGASAGAVFPALDPAGRIRYLQTRYLEPGDGPKYDNPAAVLGSNPRVAWTRSTGVLQPGALVVCEGIPDALTAAGAGLRSVAVLGSQAPDRSVASRIAHQADECGLSVVAVVDNDDAGRSWGTRLSSLLAEQGTDLTVVEPPDMLDDLNTWATKDPDWMTSIDVRTAVETPLDARPDPTRSEPQCGGAALEC